MKVLFLMLELMTKRGRIRGEDEENFKETKEGLLMIFYQKKKSHEK